MHTMAWNNQTYLIGERVKVEGEKQHGVITRIDADRGLIYVLFPRMREEAYPYPEAIDQFKLKPEIKKK
ncbi:MAG: hypothetical protein ACLFTZ_06485 [Acholeplasmataceae bacterium]